MIVSIRQTAGVYAFFAQLFSAFAPIPNAWVRWWETGVISERHFPFQEKIYRFRPDALASVQCGARTMRFWLEWDRGTMTPKDLRLKFTTYAMYLSSREWARSSPYLPAILCVTPDIAQERRLTEAAQARLGQVPTGLCLCTTTAQLLLTQGILQPIWRQMALPRQQVTPDAQRRVALFGENEMV